MTPVPRIPCHVWWKEVVHKSKELSFRYPWQDLEFFFSQWEQLDEKEIEQGASLVSLPQVECKVRSLMCVMSVKVLVTEWLLNSRVRLGGKKLLQYKKYFKRFSPLSLPASLLSFNLICNERCHFFFPCIYFSNERNLRYSHWNKMHLLLVKTIGWWFNQPFMSWRQETILFLRRSFIF